MNKKFSLIVAFIAMFAGLTPLSWAARSAAQIAQQEKMSACSKEGKGMKGEERKAFMKDCLSSKSAKSASAESAQPSAPAASASKAKP